MKQFIERFRRYDGSWIVFDFESSAAWAAVGMLRYFDVMVVWQRPYWWPDMQRRGLRRLGVDLTVYRFRLVLGSAHVIVEAVEARAHVHQWEKYAATGLTIDADGISACRVCGVLEDPWRRHLRPELWPENGG